MSRDVPFMYDKRTACCIPKFFVNSGLLLQCCKDADCMYCFECMCSVHSQSEPEEIDSFDYVYHFVFRLSSRSCQINSSPERM